MIGLLLVGVTLSTGCAKHEEPKGSKYLVLVEITASDCHSCRRIHQIIQNLKPLYKDKMTFVTLDVSDPPDRKNAQDTARRFHSQEFVKRHQNRPGTVAILNGLNGEPLQVLQENTEETRYIEMIEAVLQQVPADFPQ